MFFLVFILSFNHFLVVVIKKFVMTQFECFPESTRSASAADSAIRSSLIHYLCYRNNNADKP